MNQYLPAIISAALTCGVLLVVYAIYKLRTAQDPLARMEETPSRYGAAPEKKAHKSPVSDYVNKRVAGSSYAEKTARRLSQADIRLTPAEFLSARIGAAALGLLFGMFLGTYIGLPRLVGALALAVVGYMVPAFVIGFKRRKRISSFNSQLADTTMMLANSLRAGYSLLQSMDLMARDAPQPTAMELRRVVQEVGVGLTLADALANLLRRVPSGDLDLLITAIGIQQEVGGNLSLVLEGIAHTIRERVRIKGEVRVLTSQGRYSGYVITCLPIAMAVLVNLINPGYMNPLFKFPWIVMPIASAVMIVIAYAIIRKIVNIEV